jgi:hypothetical protein
MKSIQRLTFVCTVLAAFLLATTAYSQTLSPEQRKCLDGMHRSAAKIAKTQAKQSLRCIKSVIKGRIAAADAEACETSDPRALATAAALLPRRGEAESG